MPYDIVTHQESLHCFGKESRPVSDNFFQRQKRAIANLMRGKLPEQCSMKNMVFFSLLLAQIRTVQSSPIRLESHNFTLTEQPVFCPGINAAIARETHAFNMSYAYYANRYLCTDPADCHEDQSNNLNKTGAVRLEDLTTIPGSFFNFPTAQASSTTEQNPELEWDSEKKFLIIRDEVAQNNFFSKILTHLAETKKISPKDAHQKEFEWRLTLAGQPLYIVPIKEHSVEKRRSFADIQKATQAYVKENCVIETRIVNPEGRTTAEAIIFYVDEWEQFLTWPDSYLRAKFDGITVSPTQSKIFDNTGFAILLAPGIISMSVLGPLRDWAKQRYYSAKGDDICRIVQNRALLEHAFSFIEVGNLGKTGASGTLRGKKTFFNKPPELRRTIPVESHAIFYAANKQAGTQTELILTAKKYSDRVNQYENLVLTEESPSNYIGHYRNKPENKATLHDRGIKIEYDDLSETWRETLPPHMPLLNVEFQSGRTFVTIMGERYPLHMAAHNQYQVAVRYANGKSQLLPVYRDRISKSWHLEIDGKKPLFSAADERFIQRLKIEVDRTRTFDIRNNDNPFFYGEGEVIDVTTRGGDPSFLTAVEMHGEVIPIQTTLIEHHGIRYDTASINNMRDDSRTIVWDGDRWSLEGATSRSIAKSLKDRITPSMYATNVDIPHLSGPDQRGIRWDANHNGYLKVKNEFVQILPESRSTLLTPSGAPLSIVFQNGKYHLRNIQITVPPLAHAYNPVRPFAQLPDASGVHDDHQTLDRAEKTLKYFIENIWLTSFENDDLYWKVKSYLKTDDVKVEQVPSSQLQTVRTIISTKGEVAVLDISLDNKEKKILAGAELDLALSKYHERKSGNNIKHAIGLVQNLPPGNNELTHARVAYQTRNLMKTGSATIKGALATLDYPLEDRILLLGNDDFLGEGSFSLNACADPKIIYEALVTYFISLSHAFPNAIIVPGTIYISKGISEEISEKHLRYKLSSSSFTVKPPIFFTAIIAPVFHNGKIVTIARKGEYLEYDTAHKADTNTARNTTQIFNLDNTLPSEKLLISRNEEAESFLKPGKCRNSHAKSIFAGKTLLPGEAALVESILRPHMANTINTNIFQNDFLIEGDKFLFVIGNEAKESHSFQPTIRKELLSTSDKSYQGTRYDWLLHTSTGEMIDSKLQALADNYLQVDSNDQSQFKSMISQRMHSLELAAGSGISMHRYDLAESK